MDIFKEMSLSELKGWEKKWQELGQDNIDTKIIEVFWWREDEDPIRIGKYKPKNKEDEKQALAILEKTFENEQYIVIGRR